MGAGNVGADQPPGSDRSRVAPEPTVERSRKLGQLLRVDAREIWQHEAHHFTPWLRENVARLNDALGLEIEIEASEVGVGDFSADLQGEEVASGRPVVIENQLTPTDHTHLGQLVTYSAGLDAAVVIWIAPRFRDEHRQAIDWLNQHTDEGLDFFGVEMELLRIDDSLPAPHFKLVAQPNDWRKVVRRGGPGGETTARDLRYLAFFASVLEEAKRRRPDLTSASRAKPQSWMPFGAGRAGLSFLWVFRRGGFDISLVINTDDAARNKALFDQLHARRREVEDRVGLPLLWERMNDGKMSHISARREGASIDDEPTALEALTEWGVSTMIRFVDAMRPLVRDLGPAEPGEGG